MKATFGALEKLRTISQIEEMRGVQLRAVKVVEAAPAGAAPAGDVKA